MTSECPEPEVCRRCKKEGHKVMDCPEPMICARCGGEGHMGRDCTEELKTRTYEDAEGNTKEIYVPKDTESAEDLFKMRIETGVNFSKYSDIPVRVTGDRAPDPVRTFASSQLHPTVLKNIERSGYTVPTPVQMYAIPIIREKVNMPLLVIKRFLKPFKSQSSECRLHMNISYLSPGLGINVTYYSET